MERKEWPPPPSADVLSSPTARVTAGQGRGWGECGGQTQTQVQRRPLQTPPEHLAPDVWASRAKLCQDAFSEPSQSSLQSALLLWSLMLAIIMIILILSRSSYYMLLIPVHANLSTKGIACWKGSYSQTLDTGADKHLSNI